MWAVPVRGFLAVCLMALSLAPALAFDVPDNVTVVTAPEVRRMAAKGVPLVHTLSGIEFRIQRIPGSINVPVTDIARSPMMPKDKNAPIIFYCNGVSCPYSRRASITAVSAGYSNVYWFRGGIMEWRNYLYDLEVDEDLLSIKVPKLRPVQVLEKIRENVLVLDVRPRWWRESPTTEGVIRGTEMMIPLLDLEDNLHRLPKDRPIVLSDRLMRQSVHGAKFLKMKGYDIVGILKGGAKRWIDEDLPLLDPSAEPAFPE